MMQANWSLILNILLLIGVIFAIGRVLKQRKQSLHSKSHAPSLGQTVKNPYEVQAPCDDIITVRKIEPSGTTLTPQLMTAKEEPLKTIEPTKRFNAPVIEAAVSEKKPSLPSTLMLFISAKENRQFAGYELLQTLLAVGLRFGEGLLFHRHQFANGQGPILCSLAAATETGVFDLQNIGAFSVRGLCLFMQTTPNSSINKERFSVMIDTAKQLCEGMDAHLLDFQRQPLTEKSMNHYYQLLEA
jgi:cell division protein ZipA